MNTLNNKYQNLFSSWTGKIVLTLLIMIILYNEIMNITWSNQSEVSLKLIFFSAVSLIYLFILDRSIVQIGLDGSDILLRPWFRHIKFPKGTLMYANKIFSMGGIGLMFIVIKARPKRRIYVLWWSPWLQKQNQSAEHILTMFGENSLKKYKGIRGK